MPLTDSKRIIVQLIKQRASIINDLYNIRDILLAYRVFLFVWQNARSSIILFN